MFVVVVDTTLLGRYIGKPPSSNTLHSYFSSSFMAQEGTSKLWGGRFTGKTDPVMEKFNNSIGYDQIMWKEDLFGSAKYAQALERCGLLTKEECTAIVNGLQLVGEEWESGKFVLVSSDEDSYRQRTAIDRIDWKSWRKASHRSKSK
jgi:hypothetical protein